MQRSHFTKETKVAALFIYMLHGLMCWLVSLRYRLIVKGLDKLTPDQFRHPGGILFLPNHPAEMDPIILELLLWKKFRPRPLIVEHFYYLKGFRFFLDIVRAMPLPMMDEMANRWRAKKVKRQFDNVVEELKAGNNFLIYPSGRLKQSGLEMIGGASFVHNLLQANPKTNVVLIRTTGLWGSQFSRALTGEAPDFGKVLWRCTKIILKNGIFFAPRREVTIELEIPPADFPYQAPRLEFNKALENWYNRYPEIGPEPLKLVSYSFWKEELPEVYVPVLQEKGVEERTVPKKILNEVIAHIAAISTRSPEAVERKMHLSHDLGLDSLDIAGLYIFLDERYQIADLVPGDLNTVEDVVQAAAGYKKEHEGRPSKEVKFLWPEEKGRPVPGTAPGSTLQEVFLNSVDRFASGIACVDELSGTLTYRKLKMAALVLSEKMHGLPGNRVGVMLPSSIAAYLTILAVLLSGKVPVMINWTAGVKAIDHGVDLTGIKAVITSEKFLDRLENGELGKIEQMLVYLEELKEKISLKDKLRGLFLSFFSAKTLMKKLGLTSIAPHEHAVILFTSGTENLPKGVPLSHSNLLSNHRACFKNVTVLNPSDIMYGVLPPFHSFGFSITGLLPLFSGLKVCYAPNPNDSHGMARNVAKWRPTLFVCAPSFIKALFQVSKPENLQSLKLIISGAEKTPQDLFDFVKAHIPHAKIIEGYGITECSPVVTMDRVEEAHQGVGKPLPGIELAVIDEAKQRVPQGNEGEICIIGPNVFEGYLGNPRNPFVVLDGRRWYLSGDRGYLDKEGHLILSGRLKRFVKIGGEMVSLGGIEEELFRIASEKLWISKKEDGIPLAVSVREKEGEKPQIILFTIFKISLDEVNHALRDSGVGKIVKIAELRLVDHIPLTGTGKTHYRLLDEMTSRT